MSSSILEFDPLYSVPYKEIKARKDRWRERDIHKKRKIERKGKRERERRITEKICKESDRSFETVVFSNSMFCTTTG